jgi:hypothetical protein
LASVTKEVGSASAVLPSTLSVDACRDTHGTKRLARMKEHLSGVNESLRSRNTNDAASD